MRVKSFYLFFLILITSVSFNMKAESSSSEESFRFPILKGKIVLHGTLSLPTNFKQGDPLFVFVSPPQSSERDYGGLYKALADSLAKKGIATYRYDNRNFADSVFMPRDPDHYDNKNFSDSIFLPHDPDRFTMFDAADDLHSAYIALKKDSRFSDSPIGIIGHSEGGNAAAIETSRNPKIEFLIVLSTTGTSGELLAYNQSISNVEYALDIFPYRERNFLTYNIYFPIKIIASTSSNKKAEALLSKSARQTYRECDDKKKFFGKKTEDEYVDGMLKRWMKPRLLAAIRYNPELYYSKIKCPVFICYGKMDSFLDPEANLNGLERIFLDNKKLDYKVLKVDSVDNIFEQTNIKLPIHVSVHRHFNKRDFGKGFGQLCDSLVKWIERTKAL